MWWYPPQNLNTCSSIMGAMMRGIRGEKHSINTYTDFYGYVLQCMLPLTHCKWQMYACMCSTDLVKHWEPLSTRMCIPPLSKTVVVARFPLTVKDWEDPNNPKVKKSLQYWYWIVTGVPCDVQGSVWGQMAQSTKDNKENLKNQNYLKHI